jgi:hypothetical protein
VTRRFELIELPDTSPECISPTASIINQQNFLIDATPKPGAPSSAGVRPRLIEERLKA